MYTNFTQPETNKPYKPRLVLWPRGTFLFNTNFSGFALHNAENSIVLAFRFFYNYFYAQRSRIVKFGDWLRIVNTKIGMNNESAFTIFLCSQHVIPVPGEAKLQNLESADMESKADLLGIVFVLALSGCYEPDPSKTRDIVEFITANLNEFLILIFLCHYKLADQNVQSSRFDHMPLFNRVPRLALTNLDPLFEGILREEKSISTSALVPRSFSELMESILQVDEDERIDFNELAKLVRKSLQPDMFTLDECVRRKETSRLRTLDSNNTRTVTSTQLAEHRKLTVRQWSHMELLTKPEFRGANLRIQQDSYMAGSLIFYLKALKTASIVSCVDCGPIVLGPVKDLLLLRDLRNITVSAVCNRLQLENCHNLRIFVNCESAPIVASNCVGIEFAPYNVFYNGLFYELKFAQMELLNQRSNQWDQAICVDSTINHQQTSKPFTPLPEDQFYIQPTPFAQTYSSNFYKSFLQTIPSSYLNNFLKRRAIAQTWILRNPEHKLVGVNDIDHNYLLRRIDRG